MEIEIVDLEDYPDDHKSEFREGIQNETFNVEKIVDKKFIRGNPVYLIKWENYDDKQNTWEPYDNLKHLQILITQFEIEYNKRKEYKKCLIETIDIENSDPDSSSLPEEKVGILSFIKDNNEKISFHKKSSLENDFKNTVFTGVDQNETKVSEDIRESTKSPKKTTEIIIKPEKTKETTKTLENTKKLTKTPENTKEQTKIPEKPKETTKVSEKTKEASKIPENTKGPTETREIRNETSKINEKIKGISKTPEIQKETTETLEKTKHPTKNHENPKEKIKSPEKAKLISKIPGNMKEPIKFVETTKETSKIPEKLKEISKKPENAKLQTKSHENTKVPTKTKFGIRESEKKNERLPGFKNQSEREINKKVMDEKDFEIKIPNVKTKGDDKTVKKIITSVKEVNSCELEKGGKQIKDRIIIKSNAIIGKNKDNNAERNFNGNHVIGQKTGNEDKSKMKPQNDDSAPINRGDSNSSMLRKHSPEIYGNTSHKNSPYMSIEIEINKIKDKNKLIKKSSTSPKPPTTSENQRSPIQLDNPSEKKREGSLNKFSKSPKKNKNRYETLCFWCKKGNHKSRECPDMINRDNCFGSKGFSPEYTQTIKNNTNEKSSNEENAFSKLQQNVTKPSTEREENIKKIPGFSSCQKLSTSKIFQVKAKRKNIRNRSRSRSCSKRKRNTSSSDYSSAPESPQKIKYH